ncbi:MAG: lipid A export permease/ATP-binding protein MsbA [Nevskiaceae bacterium]|jgi:subfamily B ATP-binding cassette protein MsbA|nr:lipid A export permease/ATP-binding protein MsbA [Nevskiaceae bacterium]
MKRKKNAMPMIEPMAGPVTGGMVIYRRLLGYLRPYRGLFLIGVLGMALFALTDAAFALFIKYFIRDAFMHPNPRALWAVPCGLLVLFVMRGSGDYLGTYYPGRVGRHVIKSLRSDLFAKYLLLPTAYYDRESAALMLSRMTYNVEQVAEATTNSVKTLITDALTLIALLVWMFVLSWEFTLLVLVAAPLISWLMRVINRRFRRYSARIQASMGDVTRVAKESIEGQRVIKVFTAEAAQRQRFDAVNEHNRRSNDKLINAKAISSPVVQMVAAFGLAAVMAVAIREVLRQQIAVDGFLSYIAAMLMLMGPLRRLVNVSGQVQQAVAAASSIFDVLDRPSEPQGGDHPLARARGDLAFRDVSFTYTGTDEPVLREMNFSVTAGQTLAIVGRSGSGKSTMVSLVPRFYDATQGSVMLDGVDTREYALHDLRRQIAYVSQDVLLFDDTIRNNIAFGLGDVPAERIEAAARAAHVMEFASELPQGLDTPVGDRGGLLSGGQRQRVAIARAILKNAPVLILDEATSALDSESERHIQDALAELVHGRTTLVIAHRLSTVEQADCILVIESGRIVESGTHAQLLAREGVYAQLYRLQFDA